MIRSVQELNVPNTFQEYNKIASFFTRSINPASPVSYGTTLTFGSAGVAACEFLKWVYSDEIASILTILGGTSANRSIYTNGEITSLFPWLETVRSSFSKGLRRTESSRYPLFNEKTFEHILGTAVRSSVTGMMSPVEALDRAQNIIDDTFSPI